MSQIEIIKHDEVTYEVATPKYNPYPMYEGVNTYAPNRSIVTLMPEVGFVSLRRDVNGRTPYVFPLYNYAGISDVLSRPFAAFLRERIAEKTRKTKQKFDEMNWAYKRATKAMGHSIHAMWEELVAASDPQAIAIQKREYACFGRVNTTTAEMFSRLLGTIRSTPYLYDDVMNHRYIAYAVMAGDNINQALEAIARTRTARVSFTNMPARLPTSIYNGLVLYLYYNNPLPRPLRSIEDWTFAGLVSDIVMDADMERLFSILMRSSQDDMRNAYLTLSDPLGLPRRRSFKNTIRAYRYMLDAPARDKIRMASYARDALNWHTQWFRGGRRAVLPLPGERTAVSIDPNTTFPPPPFAPINSPNFAYLETPNALIEEGNEMGHCVGGYNYIRRCLEGRSYIFAYNNPSIGRATLELDRSGMVIQCYGKQDANDSASKAAYNEMRKWMKHRTE